MKAIDARFEELAQRLESRAPVSSGGAIASLEARLEDISARLERSSAELAAVDPGIIHSLEAQVAEISRHLAQPSTALREFEDIGPRLDDIERSLAGTRENILQAARQAAESAVRNLSISNAEPAAAAALADDLKALESLARRSDERNTKTFEAIHDTLLKIVERLGSLEDNRPVMPAPATMAAAAEPQRKMALRDAPSIEPAEEMHLAGDPQAPARPQRPTAPVRRSPAEAAAEAAVAAAGSDMTAEPGGRVRTMLGGLSRAFSGRKEQEPAKKEPSLPVGDIPAPAAALDQPLDPKIANKPMEPGSGTPDLNAIMRRVRDERGQPGRGGGPDAAKADFIAAARRAAQAAAEAEASRRHPDPTSPVRNIRIGELFRSKRKPILIAAVAVLVALAGLQLGKAFFHGAAGTAASSDPIAAPATDQPASAVSADAASTPDDTPAPADDAPPVRMVATPHDTAPAADDTAAAANTAAPMDSVAPAATAAAASAPAADEPAPAAEASAPASPADQAKPADAAAAPAPSSAPAVTAEAVPDDAGPLPLREAAEAGDPKAMFEIGSRYAEGRGTKSDLKAAAKWYEKAAELGLAPAQYRIGNFYEKGIGVERDLAKAKTWYQMAAEQGNASAMHNLAVLFAMGADGTADNDSAARWFEKAAELGVKDSQFNLGILSAKGVGVPQNLEESYKWFALVAKTGDRDAAAKRDEIANALRPEQLQRARAAAELWKPKPVDPEANTVSVPDAWHESDAKTASVDMKKAIRNIQLILNKNGFEAGTADGVMGEKTKQAIVAFQKANGLDPTGEVDEKLVHKLLEKK
jgi:localization factor PodJL